MIKLSLDEDFVACPVVDGDELFPSGVFEFNVSRILAYLERCPDDVVLVSVAVGDFSRWLDDLDEAHVAAADLARPLVLAEIAPGRFNVIDGHHRLEKARRHGVGTLQAYRL
ncbi:MAG: hypothetical protein H0U69_04725, partial [Trueperaceae bacterium]|nr:hypothetical protein [Trueperaceae bacterium]